MLQRVFSNGLGVDPGYAHVPKEVLSGQPLATFDALLKWYELFPTSQPIARKVAEQARVAFSAAGLSVSGLGFVVLHRCSEGFYFLIACTWKNNNEMWETVWYKDESRHMEEFEPFDRQGAHVPTLCVWELAPVWSEAQAWVRFLKSDRREAAVTDWLTDTHSGGA